MSFHVGIDERTVQAVARSLVGSHRCSAIDRVSSGWMSGFTTSDSRSEEKRIVQRRKRKEKKGRHTLTLTARWPPPLESLCTSADRTRERDWTNQMWTPCMYVCDVLLLSVSSSQQGRSFDRRPGQRSLIINRPFWMISFGFTLAVYLFSLQDCKWYRTEEEKDRSIKSRLHFELYNRISILISCSQPLCAPLWRNHLPERNLVQHEWQTSLEKTRPIVSKQKHREKNLTGFSANVAHISAIETVAQFDNRFIIYRQEKEWRSTEVCCTWITDISSFRDGCRVNLQDIQTRLFIGKWDFYAKKWMDIDAINFCCSYQSFCPIDRDASTLDPACRDDWSPWWFSLYPTNRNHPFDWGAIADTKICHQCARINGDSLPSEYVESLDRLMYLQRIDGHLKFMDTP